MGIQPPVYREDIQRLRSSGVINPTILFLIFGVGLKPHFTYCAGGVANGGASDRDRRTPIGWTRGPPDLINARAY